MQEDINRVVNNVSEMEKSFEEMFLDILKRYTYSIDDIMNQINNQLIVNRTCPSSDNIEFFMLQLNSEIYKLSDSIERMGIYDSVSKSIFKDTYNQIYLNNQVKDSEKKNKTTVAELTALSEQGTIYESLVNDIYSKVYKTMKNKLDAAQSMLATLSKLLSKRMQEAQAYSPDVNTSTMINNPFYVNTTEGEHAI